jgi:glycerol kinase
MLAGLGVGLFQKAEDASGMSKVASAFRPMMDAGTRERSRREWQEAVQRARSSMK